MRTCEQSGWLPIRNGSQFSRFCNRNGIMGAFNGKEGDCTVRNGKVLLLANPAAQRGNGSRLAEVAYDLLVDWLGDGAVDFALTQKPGHAIDLIDRMTASHSTVLALGGDGLVHEVVNGLMRLPRSDRPVFGVLPAGSGNDFARTLGMVDCIPDAIVQLLDAQERQFDVGCCNGEYFAETLSFGLDAAIALDTVARRERTGQQGARLYRASGIDQLLHHLDTYRFSATLDGERELSGAVHLFAVQNGVTYGGGFRICPDADPCDGLFDICYAEAPMNIPTATFKFLRAKNGKHVKYKGICFDRASSIELRFDTRPPCQIDGEPHVADSYSISLEHQANSVLSAR